MTWCINLCLDLQLRLLEAFLMHRAIAFVPTEKYMGCEKSALCVCDGTFVHSNF